MQSSMPHHFARLIFDTPLVLPPVLSPHDHLYFGAFTKQYAPVTLQDARSTTVYTHLQTGESFWISPDWLLSALLVNPHIERTGKVEPVKWYNIPRTPLLIVVCKNGFMLMGNTLNNRIIHGAPPEIIHLLEERVAYEVFGTSKPKIPLSTIEQVLEAISRRELAESGSLQSHSSAPAYQKSQHPLGQMPPLPPSEPPKTSNQPSNAILQSSAAPPTPSTAASTKVIADYAQIPAAAKQAFSEVLRDFGHVPLGNHQSVLDFLRISKDPRVSCIPSAFHNRLVDEHYAAVAQESKQNIRTKVQVDFSDLVKTWRSQTVNNPKFLTNYNLFKEKFKMDKRFKEAQKYFELEKLFKESLENFKTGLLASSVKATIDSFLQIMKELKQRGCPLDQLLAQSEIAAFKQLTEEDKKRVFDEFAKTL